jgi:hypothetical protein
MAVEVWEWTVTPDSRGNPVGVSMTCDRAKAALSRALVEAGRPGRGSIRPMMLVYAAHSGTHYLRLPVTDIAVCEHGAVHWERPSGRERWQVHSGVIQRGGQALCSV